MRDFIGHVAFKVFLWALRMNEQQYDRVLEIQIDEDRKELAEEGMAGDPHELADEMYEEDLKASNRLRIWKCHGKGYIDRDESIDKGLKRSVEYNERLHMLDEFDNSLNSLSLAVLGKTAKQNHEDRKKSNV